MVADMRRNLIAGLLLVAGIGLMASALPAMGIIHLGGSPSAVAATSPPIPGVSEPLGPRHSRAPFLPGVQSSAPSQPAASSPSQAVAFLSIPRLGIKNAPIYDRGVDAKGNMLIARGYSVTHFSYSSALGSGNAVLYGHDDIEGSVFARLKDLKAGDAVHITAVDGTTVAYQVISRTIVPATAVQILQPTGDVRLTLFTCWPNWVDTQRVVVTATPMAAA
jgi:LPXTG-site transpeptidase (sortase) family protein